MSDDIRSGIREFVQSRSNVNIDDDQDIFALGVVNSLFAMELVLFIENWLGAPIPNSELKLDNFRSVDAMAELADRLSGMPQPTGAVPR